MWKKRPPEKVFSEDAAAMMIRYGLVPEEEAPRLPEELRGLDHPLIKAASQPSLRPMPRQLNLLAMPNWAHKEPKEWAAQRRSCARRAAHSFLRKLYRCFLEEHRDLPPRGAKMLPLAPIHSFFEDRFPFEHQPCRSLYAPPPCPVVIQPGQARPGQGLPQVAAPDFGFSQSASPHSRKRRDRMQRLKEFGKHSIGAPYTLKQVYEEIDAKESFRHGYDTRAKHGTIGPETLGRGATRSRRQLSPIPMGLAGDKPPERIVATSKRSMRSVRQNQPVKVSSVD